MIVLADRSTSREVLIEAHHLSMVAYPYAYIMLNLVRHIILPIV